MSFHHSSAIIFPILLSGLLLLHASTTRAETLQQAWQRAIEHNYRLKSATAQTQASRQQLSAAQGQRLPQLNIGGSYTQLSETPSAKTQIGGREAVFAMSEPSSGNAKALVTLPVFTSGRISHNIESAKSSLAATQQQQAVTLQAIKLRVAQAYINVLRAESGVKVAQSHVDSLKAHANDVNNLYTQGMVAKNDKLAAHVELANAEQRLVQAKNTLDISRAQYNQLLVRELTDAVSVSAEFPDSPVGTLENLTQQAWKSRPEIAQLTDQMAAFEQQAKSVKAQLLPQIAINGGYQYQENRYQAYEGIWQVGVGMDWKLFDGSTRHQSNALAAQALALKQQLSNIRTQIALQVRQAWLDVQETQKRLDVTQQAIEQAEENLKVTTNRYQQGLSTNTDVLKAEDLRTTTHDNHNNAFFDHQQAKINLLWAVGIL
jgi:outer membrane protein TolC